jgi:hypothetical protein
MPKKMRGGYISMGKTWSKSYSKKNSKSSKKSMKNKSNKQMKQKKTRKNITISSY